jgi:uncharacterized membrane protein YheB (UPF0754 family)
MSDELSLFNFHETGATEKTRRLITNIIPVQNVMPETQKSKLIEDALSKRTKELVFLQDGIRSVIDTPEKLIETTNILAMYKYNLQNDFIADLHRGLYTMLTRPGEHKFLDVKPVFVENTETGEREMKSIYIYTKIDTIKKAAYGALVDDNGRALFGSMDIIQAANKKLLPLIYDDKVPMPRAFATFSAKQKDGSLKQAWISGYPLHIRKATHKISDTIIIEMDTSYAPLKLVSGDRFVADGQYIHEVSGLTAMLQFGKRLIGGGTKGYITPQAAKQIIMTIQSAVELNNILGVGVSKTNTDRLNVTIRRNSIKDMIPDAVDTSVDAQGREYSRINYKRVSDAIAQAGLYYYKAIEATRIIDEIAKQKIFIPATSKAAEFPQGDNYKNIVYLKAERARGNAVEIGYTERDLLPPNGF